MTPVALSVLAGAAGLLLLLLFLYAVPCLLNRRELARWHGALAAIDGGYPIVVPVCDRPEYLARVLDALQRVEGIEDTVIVFSQDERDAEVTRLIEALPLRKIHLLHTQPFFAFFARIGLITRIHCTASNIFFAIDAVMRHAEVEGVIVLEDDLVPSVNFYRYFQWCFDRVLLHPERKHDALTCGAYNVHCKGQIPFSEQHALFRIDDYFNPWGWAISRERWEQVRPMWSFTSWDGNMHHRITHRLGLAHYYPFLSHIDCIGAHGVNMSRSEDCGFFRTVLEERRIDFEGVEPRITDDLPVDYRRLMDGFQTVQDPDRPSEWDQKLLPRINVAVRGWVGPERVLAAKRVFPWL
jgi:hypothetical protein